jgi:lipoate-protein ligase B
LLQERLSAEIAAGIRPPSLLLLEHPHTFTFGRRGKQENLLWSAAELETHRVEVHWTDRGGDVTYHGPGQLVGYPLLPLGRLDPVGRLPQPDFVGYVRRLEEVLIRTLAALGLASGQRRGLTGVWVEPEVAARCPKCPPAARVSPSKLASIGVRIDARGVSRHGFALNVAPNMSYWQGIVACDLPEAPMVSLAELLDPAPAIPRVIAALIPEFGRAFQFEMPWVGRRLDVPDRLPLPTKRAAPQPTATCGTPPATDPPR